MTLTMRQIEREAEQHIRDLYRRLGVDKPVQSARLGAQLGAKARANVEEWVDGKCRRRGVPAPRLSRVSLLGRTGHAT